MLSLAVNAAFLIDVVHADKRARYEREQGFPITEKTASGKPFKAKPAAVYYALTYRASKREKFAALAMGYDLATDPERVQYLRRAANDGKATATPVIPLLVGGRAFGFDFGKRFFLDRVDYHFVSLDTCRFQHEEGKIAVARDESETCHLRKGPRRAAVLT